MQPTQNLEVIYLQIRTDKFYYLKFILEAYDGLAILSSSGIRKDIVLVRYPGELRQTVFELLASIAAQINPYGKN
ncbi:DUF4911 domain-containing protein [Desulfopila inferna]|uniref:DUF4911 domain-containing protein n=1 Tax=Desulfopila inferna TaxID=468528 RepID=UPI001965229E|nr:DUF4911 domain-containing protein [Desulfopila inferna]MBM9602842.1 DUF4911 domain-containing protein [Desulfopila inferna]